MTADRLNALADRCEAAGPDRELDARIACALLKDIDQLAVLNTPDKWVAAAIEQLWNIARYTASLDAAMTLVPEGCARDAVESAFLRCWMNHGYDEGLEGEAEFRRRLPSYLCAAALRARASGDNNHG